MLLKEEPDRLRRQIAVGDGDVKRELPHRIPLLK
jgi:hypothetical protein